MWTYANILFYNYIVENSNFYLSGTQTLPVPSQIIHLIDFWPSPLHHGHRSPSNLLPVPAQELHSTSIFPEPPQWGHVP